MNQSIEPCLCGDPGCPRCFSQEKTEIPPEWRPLYDLINQLMAKLGAEGQVTLDTRDGFSDEVLDALWRIDGGVYKK